MMLTRIRDFFFEPRVALVVFVVFIISYLILLDEEGTFADKFLNFGPSHHTKFLNMSVNTWEKAIIVYMLAFVTSLLTSYYGTVMYDFIHSKVFNPAFKDTIDVPKNWVLAIVSLDPILFWILGIIQFFINLTMELQFIVPQLIGTAIIDISYAYLKVSQNKFTS